MGRFKQRSDVVSFTFFSMRQTAQFWMWRFECDKGYWQRESRHTRKERMSSWSVTERVRWPVWASSTERVAVCGSLTGEVPDGQHAVKESTEAFDPVTAWDCGIVTLKGVGKNQREFHLVLMRTASVFHYLHEVCFVSSSFWYQNNRWMWFSEEYGCFQVRHSYY